MHTAYGFYFRISMFPGSDKDFIGVPFRRAKAGPEFQHASHCISMLAYRVIQYLSKNDQDYNVHAFPYFLFVFCLSMSVDCSTT